MIINISPATLFTPPLLSFMKHITKWSIAAMALTLALCETEQCLALNFVSVFLFKYILTPHNSGAGPELERRRVFISSQTENKSTCVLEWFFCLSHWSLPSGSIWGQVHDSGRGWQEETLSRGSLPKEDGASQSCSFSRSRPNDSEAKCSDSFEDLAFSFS